MARQIQEEQESSKEAFLSNRSIAELLAREAETARPPLQRAFRRAARRAFLWPDEAAQLVRDRRSLTELPAIGPYLEKIIRRWIEEPPLVSSPPEIRSGFLTFIKSRAVIARKPAWLRDLKGDLQMHTNWSDGSGSITEMAETASARGYEYIAITDHSQGLKIAGGINKRNCGSKPSRSIRSMMRCDAKDIRAGFCVPSN